jgi:hypothetical protein
LARFLQVTSRTVPQVATFGEVKPEIIGHVLEGPALAHVVYRASTKSGAIKLTRVNVMSVKRSPQGWRGLLGSDLEGLASAISKGKSKTPVAGRSDIRRDSSGRQRPHS